MTDDELVFFFAYGKNTDLVPGKAWLRDAIARLVELRIIEEPRQTDNLLEVIAQARIGCQRFDIRRSRP